MNYREATDNQLLEHARDDADCFGELLRRYEPKIAKMGASFPNLRSEDCAQEGGIALVEAIMHFDPTRGTRFATYVYVCVRNRLLRAWKKANTTSDWQDVPQTASTLPSPEERLLMQEALDESKARAKRLLSKYEYAVWRMRIDGYTYAEIAVALSTPRRQRDIKSINNALVRVRNKLSRKE